MNRYSSQFNIKWKAVFLLCLFLVASSLWAKVLFFSSPPNKSQDEEKIAAANTQINNKTKIDENFDRADFKKIYQSKNNVRQNPFRSQQQQSAKFSYQAEVDNTPLKLQEIDNSLKLQGVVNQTTAIVTYNGQNLLVKEGAKVGGYSVIEIQDSKIIYSKQGRKYYSTLTVNE